MDAGNQTWDYHDQNFVWSMQTDAMREAAQLTATPLVVDAQIVQSGREDRRRSRLGIREAREDAERRGAGEQRHVDGEAAGSGPVDDDRPLDAECRWLLRCRRAGGGDA